MEDADISLISDDKPKLWISGDIPGGVAKIEESSPYETMTWVLTKVAVKN